jgi:hypothetical protein
VPVPSRLTVAVPATVEADGRGSGVEVLLGDRAADVARAVERDQHPRVGRAADTDVVDDVLRVDEGVGH